MGEGKSLSPLLGSRSKSENPKWKELKESSLFPEAVEPGRDPIPEQNYWPPGAPASIPRLSHSLCFQPG